MCIYLDMQAHVLVLTSVRRLIKCQLERVVFSTSTANDDEFAFAQLQQRDRHLIRLSRQ